jgi:hypothetical protein
VPERELLVALDEKVRLEELADRRQQVGRRAAERTGELVEREASPERGGDRHGVARLVREPAEALAHLVVHATRKAVAEQLRAAAHDADPVLFPKAEQHLDDEERAPVRFRQQLQDGLVGLRPEHVGRQPRHGVAVEGAEDDRRRSVLSHLLEGMRERRRLARRTKREYPQDRQVRETHRQRANRSDRSAVRPVSIVDRDEQRRCECRTLEQLLQVAHQPEALFGLGMKAPELVRVEQGLGSFEERGQEGGEIDHRLAGIRSTAADPNAEASGDRRHLCEQPALAQTGGSLDDDCRLGALAQEAFELSLNHPELRVAPVNRHQLPGVSIQIARSCDAQAPGSPRHLSLQEPEQRSSPDEWPSEHRSRPWSLG